MSLRIYYDGDCPFCSNYVQLLRLRGDVGEVALVDLREDAEARQKFTDSGLDPDEGMLVETEGGTYHAADALNVLSLMSSGSGLFNRLNALLFRNRLASRVAYPLLRAGRNATLLLLGRESMRAKDPGETALFELFSRFLGVLAVLHVLIYFFRFAPLNVELTTVPLLVLGIILILAPGSRRAFVLTIIVFAMDGWLNAPIYSNHTILKNFLVLVIGLAGLWCWLRGHSWEKFFRDFRPVARVLLLIMYVFGIFHKINSDFLNPEVSCAVALWREMPPPLVWIDHTLLHYLAIYGTFIVEGIIMIMLIVTRWRHLGISVGIAFHTLLALSAYAMYPAFSTLSLILHILFLSPGAALKITQSESYKRLDQRIDSLPGLVFISFSFISMALAALFMEYNLLAAIWLFMMIWPMAILIMHGKPQATHEENGLFFWSPLHGLNLIGLLFFLSCIAPYLGLKTAQAMNMFANLRLEGGVNNHLILRSAPGPFTYLDDLVVVTSAEGSPQLERLAEQDDRALVYYHFLSILAEHPETRVEYSRNGGESISSTATELLAKNGQMLHPAWMRKFFHFRSVDLTRPTPCD